MKAKLQPRFITRFPLSCMLKGNTIWFRSQIEVACADGLLAGSHLEFYQISADKPLREIGEFIIMLLERFQAIGDLSLDEVKDLTGFEFKSDEYNDNRLSKEFIKKDKDRRLYTETLIEYTLETNKYSFLYCWYEKYRNSYSWTASEDSYGTPGVLTFNTCAEQFRENSDRYCFVIDVGGYPPVDTGIGAISILRENNVKLCFSYNNGNTNAEKYSALVPNTDCEKAVIENGRYNELTPKS